MPIHIPAGYKLPMGTLEEMRSFLQRQTDTFGTYFSLDRILYHQARYSIKARANLPELRALAGVPDLQVSQRKDVLEVMRGLGIPDYKLVDKDNKLSTSKEVINRLVEDAELNENQHRFVELYQSMARANYMVSYFGQYVNLPLSKAPDCDGNRMVVAHPKWTALSTSRMSGSEPSVQNINRDVSDIYTAPQGWQMVFSDSGQIEPRITYSAFIRDELIKQLIIAYDDAYFGLLHYILLTPEEETNLRSGRTPIVCHEVTQEMKDKRQRLKVLGLAGNYGSSNLGAVDPELGPLYADKVVNHPLRRQWEREVAEQVRQGADHFYAYFGTPVYPENAKREHKTGYAWQNHLVRCGLNNPIQTTASELMLISLMNVRQLLAEGEHIGMYKHDEGMFYIPADKVEERAPKFREMLSYQVDGWIPIGSDLHIGRKESQYGARIF